MSTLTIELPDELAARLAAASERKCVSPANIVREALETTLLKEDESQGGRSLYERMKDGIGCIDSGMTDLASNPRHMAGYGQSRK